VTITRDYIAGAKARANREPFQHVSDEWTRGYNDMESQLSPIETEIVNLTFRYSLVAEGFVRGLEESFREHGTV
jgi:triphosphoribosyl-dephospho-CoA synthetase